MATVTLTSDTASLFSHDVYFKLYLDDTSTSSATLGLLDMGKLKYEFDIPSSGDDVTSIGVRGGDINVTFDNSTTGTDLIDIVESSFGYASNPLFWKGEMYFRLKGGSYGNPILFWFDQNDITYDEDANTVEVNLKPLFGKQFESPTFGLYQTVATYFINYSDVAGELSIYTLTFDSGSETDSESVISGEWLRHTLYRMGSGILIGSWTPSSAHEPVIYSNVFSTGSPSSGDEWFVSKKTKNVENGANTNNLTPTVTMVGLMATIEGAIYGGALGKTFYVARKSTDMALQVELDSDNIRSIKKERFSDSLYNNVTVTHGVNTDPQVSTQSAETLRAEKDINISFNQSGLYLATCDSSSTCDEIALTTDVVDEGAENYAKAFGFEGRLRATLTYWGIDGIYPYSVITFDSSAPAIYQSKNFRIKKIDYNFVTDTVEMEIYQI